MFIRGGNPTITDVELGTVLGVALDTFFNAVSASQPSFAEISPVRFALVTAQFGFAPVSPGNDTDAAGATVSLSSFYNASGNSTDSDSEAGTMALALLSFFNATVSSASITDAGNVKFGLFTLTA